MRILSGFRSKDTGSKQDGAQLGDSITRLLYSTVLTVPWAYRYPPSFLGTVLNITLLLKPGMKFFLKTLKYAEMFYRILFVKGTATTQYLWAWWCWWYPRHRFTGDRNTKRKRGKSIEEKLFYKYYLYCFSRYKIHHCSRLHATLNIMNRYLPVICDRLWARTCLDWRSWNEIIQFLFYFSLECTLLVLRTMVFFFKTRKMFKIPSQKYWKFMAPVTLTRQIKQYKLALLWF